MNRLYIHIGAALLTMLAATSCGSDEAATDSAATRQQVDVGGFATRAGGTTENYWQSGDAVKVYALGTNDQHTYSYDGAAWTPANSKPLLTWLPATLVAVSPAAAVRTSFTLPTTQNTAATLRAADLLTSDGTAVGTADATAAFTLSHRLCKVIVTISSYDAVYGTTLPTVTDVTVRSLGSALTLNTDGTSYTPSGSAADVTPLTTADAAAGKHKYEAIITPGNYNGVTMISMKVNGVSLTATYTGTTSFAAGTTYSFLLKVMPRQLTLNFNEGTFNNWGDTSNESILQ